MTALAKWHSSKIPIRLLSNQSILKIKCDLGERWKYFHTKENFSFPQRNDFEETINEIDHEHKRLWVP